MISLRFVIFSLVLSTITATGLWTTARALFPVPLRDARARRRLLVGVVLMGLVVTLLEVLGRRMAPFGGEGWRAVLGPSRVLTFSMLLLGLTSVVARALAAVTSPSDPDSREEEGASEAATVAVDEGVTRREAVTRALTGVVAAGALGAAVVGNRRRLNAEVREVEVFVEGLPSALEGMTLVQLTDLHLGVFTGRDEIAFIEEEVAKLRPDLVVMTGDLLDFNPTHIPEGLRHLSRIRGRRGTYTILGNHDHYTGASKVAQGLHRAGMNPLINGSVRLEGTELLLAGVDDVMAPAMKSGPGPDLDRALGWHREVDPEAPVILLAHNPVFFDETPARVKLQLSGHTHGGQIYLGPVTDAILPYVAGRFDRQGRTLFVSRGIGVTGPPVRLGAPAEVVRVALTGRRRTV